jgi:ABC-type nitrate/sulfonate/bicarbonate transport system substrate-binding protein
MNKQALHNVGMIFLLIFLITAFTTSVMAALESVTLKLAWYHNTEFLGFYVAHSQGYYADEGLDVTIKQRRETDDNILGQVATGKYDFSVGSAIYRAQAEGTPVMVIAAIYQFGPDAFFARADSGIVTPADLAGALWLRVSAGRRCWRPCSNMRA